MHKKIARLKERVEYYKKQIESHQLMIKEARKQIRSLELCAKELQDDQ